MTDSNKKKWVPRVRKVRTGQAINAGNANSSAQDLAARTEYLKERLDGLDNAEAVCAWHAPISPEILENQPVYWNATNQRFELAQAGTSLDSTSQQYLPIAESNCLGILLTKVNRETGHVALCGIVRADHLANAVDGDVLPGRYYLSQQEPGKLVQQRPAQASYVLTVLGARLACEDAVYAHVAPTLRDTAYDHAHYRFALHCLPAGHVDPPEDEGVHVITAADDTLPGWLPADHEIFDGKAPSGAAFGYNLSTHPAVERVWPPLPLQGVAMLWDKGGSHLGATEIPLGPTGLVIVDVNGIWWMSNCYGDVPWPTVYDTDSSYSDSSESLECPRTEKMRLELLFTRTVFGADKTVVTSLGPAAGSPLTFKNCDNEDATTGDLLAGIDLTLLIGAENVLGSTVLKTLVGPYKFGRGLVVGGIKAGSELVTLSSEDSYLTDEEDETTRVHRGIVTVNVDTGISRELSPQLSRLGDAVERDLLGFPYLGFPEGRDSALAARFDIPATGIPTNPHVTIKLLLFGTVTGTLPPLPMGYRIIGEPTEADPEITIPTVDTDLTVDTEYAVTANKVTMVETESFAVTAGDTLLVSLSRAADAGYLGEVGMIRIVATLEGE